MPARYAVTVRADARESDLVSKVTEMDEAAYYFIKPALSAITEALIKHKGRYETGRFGNSHQQYLYGRILSDAHLNLLNWLIPQTDILTIEQIDVYRYSEKERIF